jgi:predicted PurR-regulated permease PerM
MQRPLTRRDAHDDPPAVERTLGLAGLVLLAAGAFIIIRPFISALLWAVVITYSTSGLYQSLENWLRGRRSLAAALLTLFVAAVIVFPLVLVSVTLTENVAGLVDTVREALDSGIGPRSERHVRNLCVFQ